DTLWTKTYAQCTGAYAVSETYDHGFIFAGRTGDNTAGLDDAVIIRTDSLGRALWIKIFGGTDYDQVSSISVTPDSGFIVAGETRSFGKGLFDVFVSRMDKN